MAGFRYLEVSQERFDTAVRRGVESLWSGSVL